MAKVFFSVPSIEVTYAVNLLIVQEGEGSQQGGGGEWVVILVRLRI